MSGKTRTTKTKIAVVLLNIGGPDCKEAIKPFLFNFFTDRNIIRLPNPLRKMLAWIISHKRSAYRHIGNKSPLLDNTRAQGKALEKFLNQDSALNDETYKCFVCMRYWHPMAPQIVRDVRDWGAEHIVLLPLYPQYSTTTTKSSIDDWKKAACQAGIGDVPVSLTCCYPENDGFIKASVENIITQYELALKDNHKKIRVLLSAHGLPESFIRKGDPYKHQCERTARCIADNLGTWLEENTDSTAADLDWKICYQSRVGPMKWIGPSIEDTIKEAADDGCAVIIYPHAFTQEHVETLVELDIEYRDLAERLGMDGYYRADTAGTHTAFIAGLSELVRGVKGRSDITAEKYDCMCPEVYTRCCMREKPSIS